MASANNKAVMFSNLALALALLLFISVAESRFSFQISAGKSARDSIPECLTVYAVATGDTCFGVRQMFNLTTEFFSGINPNLNCDALFVGQWLCVDGTVN